MTTAPKPGEACPTCCLVVPHERPPRIGRNHPETAREAARRAAEYVGRRVAQIVQWLDEAGPNGLTDDEVIERSGWGHQSTTPRMNALRTTRRIAWLYRDGKPVTRPTRRGRRARVNVLAKYLGGGA